MKNNNSYLLAISCLERAVDAIKVESRVQLNRSTLELCKMYTEMCGTNLISNKFDNTFILGYIVDSTELLKTLLENPEFIETDSETKELLYKNLVQVLDELYLYAGKYYYEHEFDYNVRLDPLLQRIVDKCILKGFFFGVEKELGGE